MMDGRLFALAVAFLAVALMALAGCGGSGQELVPVSGKITYGGGAWPKPGKLTFLPQNPPPGKDRPASADFDKDGSFQATSYKPGDGLVAGVKYKVSVECWETPPTMENPASGKSAVPPQFQNPQTSGLEVHVEHKAIKNLAWDVPKP